MTSKAERGVTLALGRGVVEPVRAFVMPQARTMRQDIYMMQLVRQAGLHTLVVPKEGSDRQIVQQALTTMVETIYATGLVGPLLAGMLVEDGRGWEEAEAGRNAEFFYILTDEAEKRLLLDQVAKFLSVFWARGRTV